MNGRLSNEERIAIYARFIEAADVLRRLPPVRYPKQFGNSMPDVVRDYADALGREDTRDKREWSFDVRLEPPSASAITRMEQVTEWSIKYLMGYPRHRPCSPRECLWSASICAVSRRSFAGVCRKRGWAKTTAFARITQALVLVRDGLSNDGIELRSADVDYIELLEPKYTHSTV